MILPSSVGAFGATLVVVSRRVSGIGDEYRV